MTKMKNIFKALCVLVLALCIFLVACDGGDDPIDEKTDIEKALEAKTDGTLNANLEISITKDGYELYKEEAIYTLEGDKYKVAGTIKKVNPITEEAEYNETSYEEENVLLFDLPLKIEYLEDAKVENGVLSAGITNVGLKALTGKDAINGNASVKFEEGKIKEINFSYEISSQLTVIKVSFSY